MDLAANYFTMTCKKIVAISGAILCFFPSKSEMRPCLIFSSPEVADYAIDLSKFNRITFHEHSMTLSNTEAPTEQELSILYSNYKKFRVDEAEPSEAVGMEEISMQSVQLAYNNLDETLCVRCEDDYTYSIGVFDIGGRLVATGKFTGPNVMSISDLAAGIYVAVISGNNISKTIKFKK